MPIRLKLNPSNIRFAVQAPNDAEVTGGWGLIGKDLFRAYSGDWGAVNIYELRNQTSGVYTYVDTFTQYQSLQSQGWLGNGVAFSVDPDLSLPLHINSTPAATPPIALPGLDMSAISGYLDTYQYAANQKISEWRFLAKVSGLKFNNSFTLDGAMMVRYRQEYTDESWWIDADVLGFDLPSLAATAAGAPLAKGNGHLNLRLFNGQIDQWQIQAEVENYQLTDSLSLSGSLDLYYENSKATQNKSRYRVSGRVKNFDFTTPGFNLQNLDVSLTNFLLNDGQVLSWNLATSVQDLQIGGQFKVSGDLNLSYLKDLTGTHLHGDASVKNFDLDLGSSASLLVGAGAIAFDVNNGKLDDASVDISQSQLKLNESIVINLASGSLDLHQLNGIPDTFDLTTQLSQSTLGVLKIDQGTAAIHYQRSQIAGVAGSHQQISFGLTKTDLSLNLGPSLGVQQLKDVTANLNWLDGSLVGYQLSAGSVDLQIGSYVHAQGSFSVLNESVGNDTLVHASIKASQLTVAIPNSLSFSGTAGLEFSLKNESLTTLKLTALAKDVKFAGYSLDGSLDLQLDHFVNGAPQDIKLSAGIQNFNLGLASSPATTLTGEIQDLTIHQGVVQQWTLIGSINDFSIANQFSAKGFARLNYAKQNNISTLTGSVGVNDFKLLLPAGPTQAAINGQLDFNLVNDQLQRWKLTGGVNKLKIVDGIEISGDLSLEYLDHLYASNPYKQDTFLLDANLKQASFKINDAVTITVDGSLKDLTFNAHGDVLAWGLQASVHDLTLFDGFKISGNLNLDYKLDAGAKLFKGSAEVTGFSLPVPGLSAPSKGLSGKLDFQTRNNVLQEWTLSAEVDNLTFFNNINITGHIEISTILSNPIKHRVKATVDSMKLDLGSGVAATLAGQLDLNYLTYDGSIYPIEETLVFQASRAQLKVGTLFSVDAAATVHYSLSQSGVKDFSMDAKVNNFNLAIPGSASIVLKGDLSVVLKDSVLQSFKLNSTVSDFKIGQFSLDGSVQISYASAAPSIPGTPTPQVSEGIYSLRGDVKHLTLASPDPKGQSLSLEKGLVSLDYGDQSGILDWSLAATITNWHLFDFSLSGAAEIAYTKKAQLETFTFKASVDTFKVDLGFTADPLSLSGKFALVTTNGALDQWSLAASVHNLNILGFSLDGDVNLDYQKSNPLAYKQTTFAVSRASISVELLAGYFAGAEASLIVSNVLLVQLQGRDWKAMSWKTSADLKIGTASSAFALHANLDISYLNQDPLYAFKDTLTLSGAVQDFHFQSDYFSIQKVDLILEKLVIVGGESNPRSLKFNGKISDLNIANVLGLSGSFSGLFDTTSKGLDFSVKGSIDQLKIAGFNLFDYLSISSGEVEAVSANGSLDVNLTAKFRNDSKISIGGFDLAFKDTSATLKFSKVNAADPGKLSFSAQGLMELGSTHTPVSGGFSASIDLATGKPSLDDLTLSLTPDGKPTDYGIFKLDAPSSLRYKDGQIKLTLDPSINADIFNGLSTPIFNTINTIRPAVQPVVDLLTTQIPNDIVTKEAAINIPAISLPVLERTGWRTGIFGIRFPVYSIVMKEIIPASKQVIVPSVDIGGILTNYIENYPGNPYKNHKLEVIELIDGLGASFFYINQKLAQTGVFSDAFQPYVDSFGAKAYTMAYPSIAPIVGTLDTLLGITDLATKQLSTMDSSGAWVHLDPFSVVYDINTGKLTVNGPALGDIASKFGAFGDLYNFTNNTFSPSTTGGQDGNSASIGFANNSSLHVPFLDNPAKSIVDFILDKPIDVFQYDLSLAASLKARGSVDLGSWVAAVIGVPIPLILGANPGLGVNLDTSVGFTASSKSIKDLAANVQALLAGHAKFDDILKSVVTGVSEPNTGVYVDISKNLLTLKPELSVDLSLDYKILGLRAQIGLSSTLSAALNLIGNGAPDRIYLNNLIRPLFDPAFIANHTPHDLVLALKPGKTSVWFDVLAKIASPWFSIFRLQADLPVPKISLQIPLGTVYTGPTYGPASLYFQSKFVLPSNSSHPDLITDFYSGFADQQGLFDRIAASITAEQPQGILYVAPSPYTRDVLTGIPRSLALFDQISSADPIPDVLNVSTSLDSVAALMDAYAIVPSSNPGSVSVLERISGYSSSFSSSQSSYQLINSDTADIRTVGLAQLQYEYQLQAVLVGIQDLLRAHHVSVFNPVGFNSDLPQDEAIWPYMLLEQYLTGQIGTALQDPHAIRLDFQDPSSLKALFLAVERAVAVDSTHSLAVYAADAIAELNRQLVSVSTLAETVDGSALLAPLAITGLKQLFQAHGLEMALKLLAQQSNPSEAEFLTSWTNQLALARSSQTTDTFADVYWAVADSGKFNLKLSHAATEAGAFVNVRLASSLAYGVDYRLKGYTDQPVQLFVAPGQDHLDLEFEWLRGDLPSSSVDFSILSSHSGLQPIASQSGLHVVVSGSSSQASVQSFDLGQLAADPSVLHVDSNGVFTLPAQSSPYLLMGFDRGAGHRLALGAGVSLSLDQLRIIDGVLYAGTKAIGLVLGDTLTQVGNLAFADHLDNANVGRIAVRLAQQTLTEDHSLELLLTDLLDQANCDGQSLLQLATSPRLKVDLVDGRLVVSPDADFAGPGSLLLTLQSSAGVQSIVEVPLLVTAVSDPLRSLQTINLTMNEDGSLTLPFSTFTGSILDVDHFSPVTFVALTGKDDPSQFLIDVNSTDQTLVIKPVADLNGSHTLDLQVSSHGVSAHFDVSLNINPVNDVARSSPKDYVELCSDGSYVFSASDFPFTIRKAIPLRLFTSHRLLMGIAAMAQ
jgi:hypothetical protein